MTNPLRVLVACGENWDSPARLPRVLQNAGCEVDVFCSATWGLAQTRFIDRIVEAPQTLDEYVDALRAYLEVHRTSYQWIIVADDPLLAALVRRANEPWLADWFPVDPASSAVSMISSKVGFVGAALASGLHVPPSHICSTFEECERAAEALGFPIVLKASESYSGLGVRAAHNSGELADAFREVRTPLVVQKFIQGRLGNTIALFDHGVPVCSMSSYKVRTWPGPFGPSSARQFMSHPEAESVVAHVGALTGFHGLGAVDWVRDESTDKLVVLEFNARPVPTLHMGPLAGVDFSVAIRSMLEGNRVIQEPAVANENVLILPMFPEDFYRAATEGTDAAFETLQRELEGYCDVPWDDEPLLNYHLRRRVLKRCFARLGLSDPTKQPGQLDSAQPGEL